MNNRKKQKNKKGRKKQYKSQQSFGEITKTTLREAGVWIFSVIIVTGFFAFITGRPLLFTIHRSLYMIGMALGIYAILESIIRKDRSLKEKEARSREGQRVRKLRNIGIYRGFIVMGAAFVVELFDYFVQ